MDEKDWRFHHKFSVEALKQVPSVDSGEFWDD